MNFISSYEVTGFVNLVFPIILYSTSSRVGLWPETTGIITKAL